MAVNTEVYFRIIIAIILNYDPEAPPYEDGDHMKLKRLEMAIDYKQKKVCIIVMVLYFVQNHFVYNMKFYSLWLTQTSNNYSVCDKFVII